MRSIVRAFVERQRIDLDDSPPCTLRFLGRLQPRRLFPARKPLVRTGPRSCDAGTGATTREFVAVHAHKQMLHLLGWSPIATDRGLVTEVGA